ncbi:hypothetical protein O0L34_g15862 [Tuta absoluta]|nr:hypothetical protein O0L34_g15862 [Tuta absoluta]
MKWFKIVAIICVSLQLCNANLDWWSKDQLSKMNRRRMLQLQSQMITDLERRIHEINPIRFMYEESPHYEIGYVLAEIMERYRKMVDTVNRVNNVPDAIFHTLRILQQQQNYYQEGYNLVCMLHEIPRKYGHIKEFQSLAMAQITGNDTQLFETLDQQKSRSDSMAEHSMRLKNMKRGRIKQMKKSQAVDDLLKMVYGKDTNVDEASAEKLRKYPVKDTSSPRSVTPADRIFEYGWELNYEWWL